MSQSLFRGNDIAHQPLQFSDFGKTAAGGAGPQDSFANADLKDKKSIKELESSAVPYKNTVWHFVRVEE